MNKTVLITGAAGGLGRALAKVYGQAGWNIGLADHDSAALENTRQELQAAGFSVLAQQTDVRLDSDVAAFVDHCTRYWGEIHCLINNAGVAVAGCIDEVPLSDWNWALDINLMGVVRGCHYAVAYMKKQQFGQIINIASLAGLLSVPEMTAYNASKAAVVSLSETLHTELAPYGIAVQVVCPGFFQTGLGRSLRCPDPATAPFLEKRMQRSPLTANDIANLIFKAAQTKELYILPHRFTQSWWQLKRYSPAAYFHLMRRSAHKLYQHHRVSKI